VTVWRGARTTFIAPFKVDADLFHVEGSVQIGIELP
jgi:hypothetical protein